MIFWPKDAFCVGYLETFEAMPLRFKLIDLSQFLAAPLMTLAAYLHWAGDAPSRSKEFSVCVAVLIWLLVVFIVSKFVRGYRARSLGVAAQPENPPSHAVERQSQIFWAIVAIVWGILAFLAVLQAVYPYGGHPHFGADDQWISPLSNLSIFFFMLSGYARARCWKALPSGTAAPATSL